MGFSEGVNFYAYVENNPINATDPSGNVSLRETIDSLKEVRKKLGIDKALPKLPDVGKGPGLNGAEPIGKEYLQKGADKNLSIIDALTPSTIIIEGFKSFTQGPKTDVDPYPNYNLSSSGLGSGGGTGGGFVIYPSKPNSNMMKQVYSNGIPS